MSVANSVIDLPDLVARRHCCPYGMAIFACEKDRLAVFPRLTASSIASSPKAERSLAMKAASSGIG
ncbi:hypothetical protein P3T24_001637 [Paraburkholderia sp. GAS33]